MGRRLCTDVPQVANLLILDWPHLQGFEEKDKEYKQQQKEHYDSCHRVRPVTPLPDDIDVDVWINVQGRDIAGRIDSRHPNPRSHVTDTPSRQVQREDPVCSQLMTFCQTQWPSKHNLPQELSKYWTARHHLTVCDKLLLYETRIVVPRRLQHETLCKIHKGHQDIERCCLRMSTSVWWPGASAQLAGKFLGYLWW